MSNGFWRTKKQDEQFENGKSLIEKVEIYQKTWINRCYGDGIPDEVPRKLTASNRAPSYKAIATAILKNDHNLHSLGFSQKESPLLDSIIESERAERNKDNDTQQELFA